MNRKPGAFPFAYSQIALLIFSLTVVSRAAYAEPNEAPAVLQFAHKYKQEQIDVPRYKPSKKTPESERNGASVSNKPVVAPVANQPPVTDLERDQLLQLKEFVTQKEREMAAQSQTIQKLEKQLSTLKQVTDKAAAVSATPAVSSRDMQKVQAMIESLYRTFTLRPAPGTLAENLKQANQRAEKSRLAEAAMQGKQKNLKLQLDELQKKIVELKNNRAQINDVRETSLNAKLDRLNKQNDQLESDLAASRQKSSQAAAQVQQLENSIRKLESENKQYDNDNKQLILQISDRISMSETLERAKNKQNKLQDELVTRQQQVMKLQSQLDASAQLVQKQERSITEQAKSSSETLIAEKKSAEDKINVLQDKLTTAQHQQTALLAEKQELQQKIKALQAQQGVIQADKLQLQQKLQSDLKGNEKSYAALVMQLKELQGKLGSAQEQQKVVQSEKDKLQHQLDNAPDAAQLADSLLKIKVLQGQIDTALILQKKDVKNEKVAKTDDSMLTAKNKAAESKIKALQLKLDATQAELSEATKQSASSKAKGLLEVTPETLKKKSTREAYAIGVSLGTEILQLQAENRNWAATDNDKPNVLAGIIDSFQGREKLPPAELHKALINISKRVKSDREKYMGDLDKSTKNFMAKFTKQKNVKKSESGFWYRVGYSGDTPIPTGATIDVVVKESLANGTVVEDMDAKGIVLTQPISAFPPVFREALSKLKNHGSITIVAPPALAYGDKGYPPKVPPNATMIYELRISDVYPENAKK